MNINKKNNSYQETTKKDGSTVYQKRIYLGMDQLTGTQVRTTITSKTKQGLKLLTSKKIQEFEANGFTTNKQTDLFKFSDLVNAWFNSYKLGVKFNSIQTMESLLNCYILPAFGSYKITKLTSPVIQLQVNKWAEIASTSLSVNGIHEKGKTSNIKYLLNVTKRILDYAVSLNIVQDNPTLRVKAPKVVKRSNKKLKYYDSENLKKFYEYLDQLEDTDNNAYDITLYKTLLATGLRIGEALALEWSDFDSKNSVLHITKTVTRIGQLQKTPKSSAGVREVSLDKNTLNMLLKFQWRQRVLFSSKELEIPNPIFPSNVGTHRARSQVQGRLLAHFKESGLKNIGFHGFRHTHASLLLNAGAGYKDIQVRLGHSSIKLTMDTYSHLEPKKAHETSDIFAKAVNSL